MFKRPYRKLIYRNKVKILLVQIVNRNLGDQVIADNAAYLVRQALPRLTGRHYVIQHYDIQSEDYEMAKTADLILFDGGGLIKYRQEEFHVYVPALLDCARDHGIPVFFNCVGVEGYDASDARCKRLAEALNYPCVKGITVRDDLDTLRREYLHTDQIFTAAATDPAVFTPQVYPIRKDTQSKTIGLGIVRSRIFEDYGLAQVTREFQLELWQGITKELEARGYTWQFFVNGLRSDYDFALEILAYMGRQSESGALLAPRPAESSELVSAIASYAGIIACRMHANIIAYALGIASVGLVWNEKMVFWGERIGCPQRFLRSPQFDPQTIVQCLQDSMSAGTPPCPKALKAAIQKPLQTFIRRYGAAAWKQHRSAYLKKPADWSRRLVATALGGLHLRYTNMNAREGLENAIRSGFLLFEADIRLTCDGRLVCVNGWSKGTYEKMGAIPCGAADKPSAAMQQLTEGLDYHTFLQCRLYGRYQTMDTAQLFAQIQDAAQLFDQTKDPARQSSSMQDAAQSGSGSMQDAADGWKLILDIGRPKKETLAAMIEELRKLCTEGTDWEAHLFMRLQSKYDVETVQESGLPVQVMYYIPPEHVREEKHLTLDTIGKFCKKRRIQWVSMPKEALDAQVMAYLKKQKLKSCLFSYNRYTDVLKAAEMGVDWIGTSYLSPGELHGWWETGYTIVVR